jgi:hypothetical protein
LAGKGELILNTKSGALVFIDGKKVAMTGDDGQVKIKVKAGDLTVKVEKLSSNGEWFYSASRDLFIGEDTSSNINLKLKKQATEKGKQRQAKEKQRQLVLQKMNTIYDKSTNLTWMRCSLGQRWTGNGCAGQAKEYTWQQATNLAKKQRYAGKNDWRLPTRMELHSIVYCSKGRRGIKLASNGKTAKINGKDQDGRCLGENYQRPTINTRKFPNTPDSFYWSSSPYAGNRDGAWGVSFYNGNVNYYHSSYYHFHVRLVRSGQ